MRAVDTSALIPALLSWHEGHERTRLAIVGAAVPSHVLLECYSVLTRLPQRLSVSDASRLLQARFPVDMILIPSPDLQRSVFRRCAEAGIGGGAVYDALIGLTASEHGATLVTRDERATRIYRELEVPAEWVD